MGAAAWAGDWEALWAPYDESTYAAVLDCIQPHDYVLDIGAGDLRLTRAIAARARQVVAIERNTELLAKVSPLPGNCRLLSGDARELPFPEGITTAVLLMRHCNHLSLYVRKLQAAGCRWLITNARWGLAPERIDLFAARRAFVSLPMGWYACLCGQTGFLPGPPELLTPAVVDTVWEVEHCPACAPTPQTHGSTRFPLAGTTPKQTENQGGTWSG